MTESVCELLPTEACDLYARRPGPVGPRTLLKRYLLDPVLPMLMLLSMSALTVAMLVAVVAAVADMDMRPADGNVTVDPWAGAQLGSAAGPYPDQGAYVDSALAMVSRENPQHE